MPRENILTTAVARVARAPFWLLARRPIVAPRRVLILKPCCLSQVMLATPLLAALSQTYPNTRFDWAISEWARPAINGNPRLTEILTICEGDLRQTSWQELHALAQTLQEYRYDTCLIPSRSSLLSLLAWWAKIPQRIGLQANGRGFAHTTALKISDKRQHEALVYLQLATALGAAEETIAAAEMEFYPPDVDRTAVTRRLVSENWLGDTPLVIIHPGGGLNPTRSDTDKRWPLERFVRLANHIVRKHKAQIILVGAKDDLHLIKDMKGLLPFPVIDMADHLSLGQLGALCEVANLYIGNDAGPTHVAAAVSCPTLAIFGPTDPCISGPYTKGKVKILGEHEEEERPFSWQNNVTIEAACRAVDQLLA